MSKSTNQRTSESMSQWSAIGKTILNGLIGAIIGWALAFFLLALLAVTNEEDGLLYLPFIPLFLIITPIAPIVPVTILIWRLQGTIDPAHEKLLRLNAAALAVLTILIPDLYMFNDGFAIDFWGRSLQQPDWIGSVTKWWWLIAGVLNPVLAYTLLRPKDTAHD